MKQFTEEGERLNTTLKELILPEKIPNELLEEIQKTIKSNTARRKKKGKKSKKKKK